MNPTINEIVSYRSTILFRSSAERQVRNWARHMELGLVFSCVRKGFWSSDYVVSVTGYEMPVKAFVYRLLESPLVSRARIFFK